jgi:hypothetical protein
MLAEQADEAAKLGARAPKSTQEMDILKLGLKRLQSHARNVANKEMLNSAGKMKLVDRAFKDWVRAGAGAVKKREGVMSAVELVNRKLFKPYVTIGLGVVPNPAFHVRNAVFGMLQAATHRDIGAASGLRHMVDIANEAVAKAVEKIPGLPKINRTQLNRLMRGEGTDAIVKGTNRTELEIAQLLQETGVTRQSFVRFEGMVDDIAPAAAEAAKAKKVSKQAYELLLGTKFPGMIANGIEDRMRANGFIAALRKGLDPADAAQATRDAFIDYQLVSGMQRNLRDVIPFAQFTIGQTPRTLRTAVENPRVFSPFRELARDDSGALAPEYVREQTHLGLGRDKEGNPTYLTGFASGFEDINKFWPGSMERMLQRGAASTTPPVKALAEQMAGKDLFFGTERGAYRRDTPFAQLMPDVIAGRKTRKIKTKEGEKEITEVSPGFLRALQYLPISRQISMFNQVFDERKSVWQKSISLLTGVKVVSVNEERELKRVIGDYLKEKAKEGDVGQLQRFYAMGDVEPELAALIKAYYSDRKK